MHKCTPVYARVCTAQYTLGEYMYVRTYLFDIKEPRIISESSMSDMLSEVSSPLRSSSPRVLKLLKATFLTLQSAMTCFNLVSMSFSFTALMQMSYISGTTELVRSWSLAVHPHTGFVQDLKLEGNHS